MPQPARQPARHKATQPARHPVSGTSNNHNGTNGKHSIEHVQGGGGDGLIFPKTWGGMEKGAAKAILKGLDQETAQLLLDELAAGIAGGNVRSPFPFLRALVVRWRDGTFTAGGAVSIQAARKQAAASAAAVKAAEARSTAIRVPKRIPGESLASRLKKMKTKEAIQ